MRNFLQSCLLLGFFLGTALPAAAAQLNWAHGLRVESATADEVRLWHGGDFLVSLRLAQVDQNRRIRPLAESLGVVGLSEFHELPITHPLAGARAAESLKSPRARLFEWPFEYLQGQLFWELQAVGRTPAALLVEGGATLQYSTFRLAPHIGGQDAPPRRLPWLELPGEEGEPLYLGIVRLDGAGIDVARSTALQWDQSGWPLALVVAPSLKALEFAAGQALASRSENGRWQLPVRCARCERMPARPLEVEAARDGEDLRLRIVAEDEGTHLPIDWANSRLGDYRLEAWIDGGAEADRVELRADADDPVLLRELQLLLRQRSTVELAYPNGKRIPTLSLDLKLDDELRGELSPVDQGELPPALDAALLQSWPNPFRSQTTISYRVPATMAEAFGEDALPEGVDGRALPPFGADASISVRIYNLGGQLIRTLTEESREPGLYQIGWDGLDEAGRPVAAGAYYVNVDMEEWPVTHRLLRLKP